MKFRKDINGLRFLAVVMVVLYHFKIPLFSGGFAGVDIFFVISGYLMTEIIVTKLNDGNFNLWGFYCSRAKRIIPALLFVCVFVLIIGWFLLFPSEYRQLGIHVLSSILFTSDITYWKEAGYFDSGANSKWLLHTWSLSVEWQFYILYPILLIYLYKILKGNYLKKLLFLALLASLLIAVYASIKKPDAGFFLLPSRAWEMLAGGLVSQIRLNNEWKGKRNKYISLLISFSLILLAFTLTPYQWPGYKATLPVFLTSLIILINERNFILDNKISQHIGKISYSLYLWHWPVVVLLHLFYRLESDSWKIFGLLISYIMANISYTFIERRKNISSLIFIAFYAIVLLLSACVILTHGVNSSVRSITQTKSSMIFEKYRVMHDKWTGKYKDGCDFYSVKSNSHKDEISEFCVNKKSNRGVFLWGDSHAQAISPGIRNITPVGWDFYQVATSSCEPTIGKELKKPFLDNNCKKSNQFAVDEIKKIKPTIVVIAQRSLHHLNNWNEISKKLKSYGVVHVVVIGPMVQWRGNLSELLTRQHIKTVGDYSSIDYVEKSTFQDDSYIRDIKNKDFTFISLIENMCKPGFCLSIVPNSDNLMVMDYGHLTPEGSYFVSNKYILPKLKSMFR